MWKQFRETNYEVSKWGLVRNITTKKILAKNTSWNGYHSITLSLGARGKRRKFMLHRMVAELFLENTNSLPEVNHKDADKTNNSWDNLEWVSRADNIKHAIENNLMVVFKGENHGCAKLTVEKVLEIKKSNKPTIDLAEFYGLSIRQIQRIRSGHGWKHI